MRRKRGGRSERNMCRINIINLNREATTGRAKHMQNGILKERKFKLELATKQAKNEAHARALKQLTC